mmetsp:Transcript_64065/g.202670  ORF Transcript_64065/g.202670 Transcript_64065/m.202670 type:complete len:1081 (-) Transcript_64065:249-3491(-)
MASTSGSKRAREDGGDGPVLNGSYPAADYKKGSVLRVEVKNFMTYSECAFEPGPRLNLVLGPNGTGKSSLVCALCVGLGGSTKLLGRADRIDDFIKRGENEGMTKITLSSGDPEKPTVITRALHRKDFRGAGHGWKINNAAVNKKDVEALCKDYNVQLDNLCQFLPQDKVVSFASLKKDELLVETEKALEDSDLHARHMKLISLKDGLRAIETSVESKKKNVEKLNKLNEDLNRDVEKLRQRKAILEEVEFIKKKLPFVRFSDHQAKYLESKEMFQKAKDYKEAKEAESAEFAGPLNEKMASKAALLEQQKDATRQLNQWDRQKMELDRDLDKICEDVDGHATELSGLERKSKDHHKGIESIRKKIADAQEVLANAPEVPDHSARINEIKEELVPLRHKKAEFQGAIRDRQTSIEDTSGEISALENRLKESDGVIQRRLAMIGRTYHGIERAYEYVRANQHKFKKPVYGPILCEVKVANAEHAKYLEQHVPNNVWAGFATQHPDDRDHLYHWGKEQRITFNTYNYSRDGDAPIPHPNGEPERFADQGITHTLDQVFESAQVIKHIMCDQAGINRAYVGSDLTERRLNADPNFLSSLEYDVVWTAVSQYTRNKSRYSTNVSTRVIETRPCRFFGNTANDADDQKARLLSEIAAAKARRAEEAGALAQAKEQMKFLLAEIGELDSERNRLLEKGNEATAQTSNARRQIEVSTKMLKRQEGKPDPLTAAPKLEKLIKELNAKRNKLALKLVDVLDKIARALPVKVGLQMSIAETKNQIDRLELENAERMREVNQAVERFNQLRQIVKGDKTKLAELLQLSLEAFNWKGGDDEVDPELREEFHKLPGEETELINLISDRERDAGLVVCSNENAIKEYEERAEKLQTLEGQLREEEAELEAGRGKINTERDEWLPKLKELIAKVDENFQRNFEAIGCSGEVQLEEAGEEYKNYAIRLLVCFRDEEGLQELTAHRQSGGERSVSTILYLISLQDVTVCPFRVVDEINQGMDPINERKVFQQLVKSACQSDTPQCFLLTPKLLPELKYSREVTILNIFNGPHISDVANVWQQELLFRKRLRAMPPPA